MKTLIRILMLLAVIQLQAQEDENASASNNDNTVIAEEVNRQDKVVETALGIKKKKAETTSSQRVIDNRFLNNASNPSIISALEGKSSGLRVIREGQRIIGVILRGTTSFQGNPYALIVLDGAITPASALQGLDPKNIDEVNIIKGGSGAALYGSQGANGVLAITTKRSVILQSEKTQPINKVNKYTGNLKIKKFGNKASYLRPFSIASTADEAYDIFIKESENYVRNSAYYADAFNYFSKWESKNQRRAMLNYILQVSPEDVELQKTLAFMLEESGDYKLASSVYLNILKLRPEESQSFRDLALMYQETNKEQRAFDLLSSILIDNLDETPSSTASNEVVSLQLVSKKEINNLISKQSSINTSELDNSHRENVKYDLRIVLDWNLADADIDLQVIDPNMEMCFYSYPKTQIGGTLTPDVQNGYGPEEYTIRNAKSGDYYIKINYDSAMVNKDDLPTYLKLTTFKDYGKPTEIKSIQVIRLNKDKGDDIVAKIRV